VSSAAVIRPPWGTHPWVRLIQDARRLPGVFLVPGAARWVLWIFGSLLNLRPRAAGDPRPTATYVALGRKVSSWGLQASPSSRPRRRRRVMRTSALGNLEGKSGSRPTGAKGPGPDRLGRRSARLFRVRSNGS
jgi:hypothetical protein